jgi:hypothetical protein
MIVVWGVRACAARRNRLWAWSNLRTRLTESTTIPEEFPPLGFELSREIFKIATKSRESSETD